MKSILVWFLLLSAAHSQKLVGQESGGSDDPAIPTPKSVLGYDIGDRFTTYAGITAYMERLASASDRAQRIVYGETYEHRQLQVIIVSSPGNIARLEAIRTANLSLTDPRRITTKAEAAKIIEDLPIIVYLSYGVHGNEASSPEAALMAAYHLCAATDTATLDLISHAVVIIDPNVNPDGHERYVQWVNGALGMKPNLSPYSIEHSEPWPGGRTNHYFFDMNRDLSWQTQQETRERVQFYRQWMPQVHVDYHEMGYSSSYFFFPAAVPIHESLPPQTARWDTVFGRGNAKAFDRVGLPYYVGEEFDMFYPGYGDSWPTFNGATGMTYEQAGGSRAGIAVRRPNGQILTLRDRAHDHYITSLATIETSVRNRKERLADFYAYWLSALQNDTPVRGYLIGDSNDPVRSSQVLSTLLRQGIEVYKLTEPARLQVQKYFAPGAKSESIPSGTFFIPTSQPQSRLARALLEPTTVARDTFFYDVSAWSLPVASGLQAWTSQSPMPKSAVRVTDIAIPEGKFIGEKRAYAYLIPWQRNNAAQMVWRLLEKGYSLSVAHRPFDAAQHHFTAGTVVALAGSNASTLATDLERIAKESGVDVYSVGTGLTQSGISLGSSYVAPMKKASIAIAVGPPVSSNDYGELWFLFEQELGIPFTGIRATELADVDLSKFDVIILPDARNYQSVFDSAKVDRLKRWVQAGGVLIGIEGGAQFLTKSKSGITPAVFRTDKKEDEKSKDEKERDKAEKEQLKRLTLYEKEEHDRLEHIPGTIFKVEVDTTHPIGFGVPAEVYAFKGDAPVLELSDIGHNVARFAKDSAQVSGYVPKDKVKKVSEAAYIQDFRLGRGRAVLFAENITFRRFWSGLEKLLLNSILFLPQPN